MNNAKRRSIFSVCSILGVSAALAAFITASSAFAQEQTEKKFFEVTISADTCYTYDKLTYNGDFFSISAKPGAIVIGKTAVGVTVAIILGEAELKISPAKPEHATKMQEAFEAAPAVVIAKQAYLRLEPSVYESMIKGATLARSTDEEILKKAKAIFDDRFNGSYHAGPLAIIPPAKTFFADLESEKFGHVIFEEGDFLRLVRVSPYKSIYPSYYVNPKR